MAELSLKLDKFAGPLDLLIHLIERDKVDIYDIPIVAVTEQYITYLRSMQEFDMEVASEFLVMAALLLQIKSRMLLPKKEVQGEEEEADPRQMLVEMLLEYKKIKVCAERLAELKQAAGQYHTRRPMLEGVVERSLRHYPVQSLMDAVISILSSHGKEVAYVERQEYDVGQKMEEIVGFLRKHPEGVAFASSFAATGTNSERVASFLAVLELLKLRVVRISQSKAFAPIYLFLRQGGDADAVGF